MAYTFQELKGKTVAQMREIAVGIDHEALQGHTQMNKEHLLAALCKALGIDMHAHHEVKGINKAELKAKIRGLKKKRDQALADHNHPQLKAVRRDIHHLKRAMRRAMV